MGPLESADDFVWPVFWISKKKTQRDGTCNGVMHVRAYERHAWRRRGSADRLTGAKPPTTKGKKEASARAIDCHTHTHRPAAIAKQKHGNASAVVRVVAAVLFGACVRIFFLYFFLASVEPSAFSLCFSRGTTRFSFFFLSLSLSLPVVPKGAVRRRKTRRKTRRNKDIRELVGDAGVT
nr:hypothetical protein [Pandoravirus aubagnensis]